MTYNGGIPGERRPGESDRHTVHPRPLPAYVPPGRGAALRTPGALVAIVVVAVVVAAGATFAVASGHHKAANGSAVPRVAPVAPPNAGHGTPAPPAPHTDPASSPAWVPITIDHPVPGSTPLPAVLSATSLASGVVVTPTLARSVVQAIWSLRDQAFTTHDRSFMAEFESGPALEADERTCGCDNRAPRGAIADEVVFVPRQSTYPATFLAEASTTLQGAAYTQYLVLSKANAASTWTVVADPGDSGIALDRPSADGAGFDVAPTPAATTHTLPTSLAAYWQTWTDTGRPPSASPFADGPWTTSYGAKLARQPQGSLVSANGLNGRYDYRSVSSDPAWAFGTATGGITCGVLRAQTLWSGPAGAGVYQPPARTNWGPTVAPGIYQAEAETSIVQPCFIQHAGAPVTVTSGSQASDTEQGLATNAAATARSVTAVPAT